MVFFFNIARCRRYNRVSNVAAEKNPYKEIEKTFSTFMFVRLKFWRVSFVREQKINTWQIWKLFHCCKSDFHSGFSYITIRIRDKYFITGATPRDEVFEFLLVSFFFALRVVIFCKILCQVRIFEENNTALSNLFIYGRRWNVYYCSDFRKPALPMSDQQKRSRINCKTTHVLHIVTCVL